MYYVITNPALSHYRKNFAVSSYTLKSDAYPKILLNEISLKPISKNQYNIMVAKNQYNPPLKK